MQSVQDLKSYFPDLTTNQLKKFDSLKPFYEEWNQKINMISRKDVENFTERHLLHSLSIALFFEFQKNQKVLDIGTGGGFPGIPLAILFPDTQFVLTDSIGKKIKVVNEVVNFLKLSNVKAIHTRSELVPGKFDWAITRAVAPASTLWTWCSAKLTKMPNRGLIALKGGDLTEELLELNKKAVVYELKNKLNFEFFETKKVVFIPSA